MHPSQLKPLLFLVFAYFIYHAISTLGVHHAGFVPYNSFEVPDTIDPKTGMDLYSKFGTIVDTVNSSTFSISYQLKNVIDSFANVLNGLGLGKFRIISVRDSKPFTLESVLIQDELTNKMHLFKRVDFIVDSLDPFKISQIIITPEPQGVDPLAPDVFRINNPLHLFYPYKTSDNDDWIPRVKRRLSKGQRK
jgi:hypothetical protein